MAGEPILIVDDTPVNLKLTRVLLVNEGYKVLTAATAEEALELLHSYHPSLILADIQLPGIDGLELTRRVKQSERTRDITVVALSAFAMRGDEQKALDAGCDGYITKPIDTRALGTRIREFLDRRPSPETNSSPSAEPGHHSIPEADLQSLRSRFLEEGQEQMRQWLLDLDNQFSTFNANDAQRAVHQWIGAAGLLGFTAISRLSREIEAILHERPLDQAQLRESLDTLATAFTGPREARDAPVPEGIVQALTGKRIALVGLPVHEMQRFSVALQRVDATGVAFEHTERPNSDAMKECQVLVIHVRPESTKSPWLDTSSAIATYPVVLVGARDHLLTLNPQIQSMAREFLMDSWQPEEALIRLSRALSDGRTGGAKTVGAPNPANRARVLIVDDDPTVLSMVRASLQNAGMDCETASDGRSAIEIIRRNRPHAAVLDINMPGIDGYEVLAAIRREEIPIRILLLTARQQESDVVRGFNLGADDYMVKPFGSMELAARLKRLLWR